MKLKVICQICGRTKTIDTGKPANQDHLGWDNYCLGDFEIDEIPGVYDTYEIWVCDKCHKEAVDHYESGGEYEILAEDTPIWGKLTEMIRVSCGIERGEEDGKNQRA